MTGSVFSKGDCLNHYKWGDDCYGWVFINSEHLTVKQELMPPDTSEELHTHQLSTQVFFVLKGRATIYIDGIKSILKPEQGIGILPGQEHMISNDQSADLEFIVYSTPTADHDRINIK